MQGNKETTGKRRKLTLFRVVVLSLLIAGCAFSIYRLRLHSKLNTRIEAIRAAGHPLTWAELDKWYAIPEGADNSADAILNALSHCQEWERQELKRLPLGGGRIGLPSRKEPLTAETISLMSEYLDDNREALFMLHEALTEIEHCRYPVDFSAGIDVQMSHLTGLHQGARLLLLEAVLHAENDQTELAVQAVISNLKIAGSLANEPDLGSQFSQRVCWWRAVLSVERVVNRNDLTDEQLTRLSAALADAEQHTNVLPALVGERCLVLAALGMSTAQLRATDFFCGDPDESPLSVHLRAAAYTLRKFVGLMDKKAILYLDVANDCIESLKLPLEHRRAAAEAIEKRLGSESRDALLLGVIRRFPRVIAEFDIFACLRTARVALAIQRYRLANGRLPDTLGDLVPAYLDAVPSDPFDGEQLRYKKLEVGFVVYSIGEDQDDDGGLERRPAGQKARRSYECDITFIVER
ncbi:MAG: hypothetical protein JSW47_11530 [Phycisphaerales bacterium]|nr:MAG: hypothetical protein JSW47_11530 [Phycisphaerales bacterium]